MIPFNKMTATEHRKRWPQALAKVWNFNNPLPPDGPWPGSCPENIFDFHDGLRLIASTDQYVDLPTEFLHVSASVCRYDPLYEKLVKRKLTVEQFCKMVVERVYFLSGRNVVLAGFSEGKAVPNFFDPPLPAELVGAYSL